jgi:hypothetical protein
MRGSARSRRRRRWLVVFLWFLLEPLAMWVRGYRIAGNLPVRCRRGHLYTTLWIPGVSLKSVRFAWWRLQWCPVGRHWSIVTPVREAELSDEEKRFADEHRDLRIP